MNTYKLQQLVLVVMLILVLVAIPTKLLCFPTTDPYSIEIDVDGAKCRLRIDSLERIKFPQASAKPIVFTELLSTCKGRGLTSARVFQDASIPPETLQKIYSYETVDNTTIANCEFTLGEHRYTSGTCSLEEVPYVGSVLRTKNTISYGNTFFNIPWETRYVWIDFYNPEISSLVTK